MYPESGMMVMNKELEAVAQSQVKYCDPHMILNSTSVHSCPFQMINPEPVSHHGEEME